MKRARLKAAREYWRRARGLRNRALLGGYLVDRALRGVWPGVGGQSDWRLQLGDVCLAFRAGNGELALYHEIFIDRIYERHPAFVPRPGWRVIDAGANIGVFTLRAARAVGHEGRVVCVEPSPSTFWRLVTNLKANGIRNASPVQAALGGCEGRGVLLDGAGSTTARLEDGPAGSQDGVSVEVLTLDSLVEQTGLDRVDLLKLDIEGGEVAALTGAGEALSRCERIVLELHGTGAAVHDCLEGRGFEAVGEKTPSVAYYVNRAHRSRRRSLDALGGTDELGAGSSYGHVGRVDP